MNTKKFKESVIKLGVEWVSSDRSDENVLFFLPHNKNTGGYLLKMEDEGLYCFPLTHEDYGKLKSKEKQLYKLIDARIATMRKEGESKEKELISKANGLNLDYDLFVLDPSNKDSTPEQIRDCIHDAIKVLDERTK